MIIKKIACGNADEAFIEDRLSDGFNIIFSDDNNKGKTIVIQSALYAIGNEPIFPHSFDYKDYYHYVEIEFDDGKTIASCRKGNSFTVITKDSISILDSVSELKRFLNRNGMSFPKIIKDDALKMVDPVLLYQLFFVGQDGKDSSSIFHDGYYKKEDFWKLIYSYAGIEDEPDVDINIDEVKNRIEVLKDEQKTLLRQNKILKSASPAVDVLSQKKNNDSFDKKVKRINSLRDSITEVSKQRDRALHRKVVNEKTLKELRSLNRTQETGTLHCLDCGSDRIAYSSGDKSYTFDITDVNMRNNIIASIQDKIDSYQEELDDCTRRLNTMQQQLQKLLKSDDVDLESILLYKNDIVVSSDADTRLVEIDKELKVLKSSLKEKRHNTKEDQAKRESLRNKVLSYMNNFYKEIDPEGTNVFTDLFSKKGSTYSGVEETEFYLAKLFALAKGLEHSYPIIMDYFRDGELSTNKEEKVLQQYSDLNNQIIFTATLKNEELDKYSTHNNINSIDYSMNKESHILRSDIVDDFRKLLKPMMVEI